MRGKMMEMLDSSGGAQQADTKNSLKQRLKEDSKPRATAQRKQGNGRMKRRYSPPTTAHIPMLFDMLEEKKAGVA